MPGLGLGAVLDVLSALICDRSGPLRPARRSVLGLCRAGPTRRRAGGGCSLTGLGGGSGPMWPVQWRVWGPACGQGGRGGVLNGGGGFPSRRRFRGWQVRLAEGCLGLTSWRQTRNRGLRQPPLLPLCGGFPCASRGDQGAGAGPAVKAGVLLGGAIGVRNCSYPVRRVWLAVPTTSYCVGAVPWAVP